MSTFDQFTQGVSEAANTSVEKTKSLLEAARLSSKIAAEKNRREKLYQQIGELYFHEYRSPERKKLEALCADVEALTQAIAELEEQVLEVKKKKICPACGAEQPADSRFCGRCGATFPSEENGIECPNCHNLVEYDSKFCTVCGVRLREDEEDNI